MSQSFFPHSDLALPKAEDSESPCAHPALPVLCETAIQAQYWVAAALVNLAEEGEGSTDGPMSWDLGTGEMDPLSVLANAFVTHEIASAAKTTEDFIVKSFGRETEGMSLPPYFQLHLKHGGGAQRVKGYVRITSKKRAVGWQLIFFY